MNSYIKKSNNPSFPILIFVILKFRNIGGSTFDHSIFCIPPKNFQLKKIPKISSLEN